MVDLSASPPFFIYLAVNAEIIAVGSKLLTPSTEWRTNVVLMPF